MLADADTQPMDLSLLAKNLVKQFENEASPLPEDGLAKAEMVMPVAGHGG